MKRSKRNLRSCVVAGKGVEEANLWGIGRERKRGKGKPVGGKIEDLEGRGF